MRRNQQLPRFQLVSTLGFWINEFSQGNLGNLIWSNAAMVANGRVSRWRGVLQLLGSTRYATSYQEAASSCELVR